MKEVIKAAERSGWTVQINGHYKFKSPEGKVVCCSYSPSCPRTFWNVLRDLKRIGFPAEDFR